jgi:hypothetical protein
MKRLYSILIGVVGLIVLASLALADPGTTWNKKINGAGRFQVLNQFGKAAVFDKETGRVWEQSPTNTSVFDWLGAQIHCNTLTTGGRLGWRLPTLQELASLVDPNAAGAPFIPTPNPFSNVQLSDYWSATTLASDASRAWIVNFGAGIVDDNGKIGSFLVWCVRGGQGVDPQ